MLRIRLLINQYFSQPLVAFLWPFARFARHPEKSDRDASPHLDTDGLVSLIVTAGGYQRAALDRAQEAVRRAFKLAAEQSIKLAQDFSRLQTPPYAARWSPVRRQQHCAHFCDTVHPLSDNRLF